MTDPEPRNMLLGWCSEGETLSQAVEAVGTDALERSQDELAAVNTPGEELRAALYLQAFTKLQPVLRDGNGLQKAVDLELHAADGSVELAEVSSSLQNEHQREQKRMERLTAAVADHYSGMNSWLFHLAYGWATPAKGKHLTALAKLIARELESFDSAGRDKGRLASADWIWARRGDDDDAGNVAVTSWSANIPDNGDEPFLDRLSAYLNSSKLIASKREKLQRESIVLGAARRHLYLWMASMGKDGDLFPTSPSYMTWGTFTAPDELTDLWLDGGSGEIYHWTVESGWVFHRLMGQ